MEALECINSRRSIRKFSGKPVPSSDVEKILKAAMNAPSAGNEQPWHFIIVKDKAMLAKIPSASPYAQMAKDAEVAIVVCGDVHLEKYKGFWVQDCCNASMNILLAAHALGYGAVWTAAHPMQDRVTNIQKLFKLPSNIIPLAIIPIGVPAETPRSQDRYNPQRVHEEVYHA